MEQEKKKYKLYMKLDNEGVILEINDEVENPFDLNDYIFNHDLEPYTIIEFKLEEIK